MFLQWGYILFFTHRSFSQQLNLPHSGKLPTVTPVLFFQTACEMTSRQCIVVGQLSAKKLIAYYSYTSFLPLFSGTNFLVSFLSAIYSALIFLSMVHFKFAGKTIFLQIIICYFIFLVWNKKVFVDNVSNTVIDFEIVYIEV